MSVQATFVLALPVTVAVNCWFCPPFSEIDVGDIDTEIETGDAVSVTLAVAHFDVSATLVAVTTTVWAEPTVLGAVYRPLAEIVPT